MSDSFDLDLGEPTPPQRDDAYRVLARKYRPQRFTELIGQDAMVQTLANAIRRGRLAHAFLLTGVRGVGKTSTARLIAKALNCIGTDGQGGPTIDPCGTCEPCRAIAEGRHIDVIEMDAASHTGVDDMRGVIDAARLSAFSARFKIYIIDEVHMLSKNAFNALLKTLEEPPPHVKFLLATTEVNKVPVTVLSRCQRFDLRRIPADTLATHFAAVCAAEGASADAEALALIARAADGSARDGLSILDQAIAHADLEGHGVTAAAVRDMLGLSDRGAMRDLFAYVLAGDAPAALAALRGQYALGVDPAAVLRALLETVHAVTLAKLGAVATAGAGLEERDAYADWAARLGFPALHRLWQLLLKGHEEVGRAALPIEAGEMALLRVIHAGSLPDPGELARRLTDGVPPTMPGPTAPLPVTVPAPSASLPAPTPPVADQAPREFTGLIERLEGAGEFALSAQLINSARVVSYAPPALVLSAARPLPAELTRDLTVALKALFGTNWRVTTVDAPGAPTIAEQRRTAQEAERAAMLDSPVVKAALDAFPGAVLEHWTSRSQ